MHCPCPDNSKSTILYQTNRKNVSEIDVRCTSKHHFIPSIFKCNKCNLIFSEHINKNFEDNYSNVEDETYISQIEFKTKYFQLFFRKIKKYLNQNSNVLEIGSYYGVLGNIIKSNVKSYIGLELSKHAAEYSKNKFDLNIANESTGTFLNKNKNFDVIIMSDVIEHLDNPFEILQLIEKNLNPNGILIFSTFNMNSITPKIMGKRYHWIMPMHKYYFSNDTLKYFLNKYNLNLFKTKTDTRLISLEYLLNKMVIIMPKIDFIFKFLLKFNFLRKLTIKINLLDLNIYFVKKLNIR